VAAIIFAGLPLRAEYAPTACWRGVERFIVLEDPVGGKFAVGRAGDDARAAGVQQRLAPAGKPADQGLDCAEMVAVGGVDVGVARVAGASSASAPPLPAPRDVYRADLARGDLNALRQSGDVSRIAAQANAAISNSLDKPVTPKGCRHEAARVTTCKNPRRTAPPTRGMTASG